MSMSWVRCWGWCCMVPPGIGAGSCSSWSWWSARRVGVVGHGPPHSGRYPPSAYAVHDEGVPVRARAVAMMAVRLMGGGLSVGGGRLRRWVPWVAFQAGYPQAGRGGGPGGSLSVTPPGPHLPEGVVPGTSQGGTGPACRPFPAKWYPISRKGGWYRGFGYHFGAVPGGRARRRERPVGDAPCRPSAGPSSPRWPTRRRARRGRRDHRRTPSSRPARSGSCGRSAAGRRA